MPDEVGTAGTGRAKHWYAAGHGLEDDMAKAFRDRRQRHEIAALDIGRKRGIGKPPANFHVDGLKAADEVTIDRSPRVDDEFGRTLWESRQGA